MQAHRKDEGDVYTLDLTDIANETRNFIYKNPDGSYTPVFCRHCDQPECVMSCMSGALTKDPETGHVQYDEKKCGSCFMCVMNCPYGVLKPDDSTRSKVIKCDFCIGVLKPDDSTRSKVIKCDFCIDKGEDPSCVKACPKQAIWVEEV